MDAKRQAEMCKDAANELFKGTARLYGVRGVAHVSTVPFLAIAWVLQQAKYSIFIR